MNDFMSKGTSNFIQFDQANEVRNHLVYSHGVAFNMDSTGNVMTTFLKISGRFFQHVEDFERVISVAFIPEAQFLELVQKFVDDGLFMVPRESADGMIYKASRSTRFDAAVKPWFEGKTVICDYNHMS